MTPAYPHQNNEPNGKQPHDHDHEYLEYEWSKGYLPRENPKPDEVDLPEERQIK